jgi:hypothetical protein
MTAMQKQAYNASLLCGAATAYVSGRPSPYIKSSPADMAYRTGLWLHANGFAPPSAVRAGRGYRIVAKSGPSEVVLDFGADSESPKRITA